MFLPVEQQLQFEGAQTFRNKKSLRFFGGAISNRSVSAFSKSQRFRDAKIYTVNHQEPEESWGNLCAKVDPCDAYCQTVTVAAEKVPGKPSNLLAWPPLQSLAVKENIFWAVKTLRKVPVIYF